MPRVYPPKRTLIALRVSPLALENVDMWAETVGVNRSEMLRRMLAYAERTMPQKWRP